MELSKPVFEGTFLQSWLVSSWNDETWEKELSIMKETGMKYLIFCVVNETLEGKYSVDYPSEIEGLKGTERDMLDTCLRNCKKHGIKVFVGINGSDRWWVVYTLYKDWLLGQMQLGNLIASELYNKYKKKYPETFCGWYWVWELFNMPLISHHCYIRQEQIDTLVKAINTNLNHLSSIDKSMPLMLSPFANDKMTTYEEHAEFWQTFMNKADFRVGDILAPQDAVGAGWTQIENLDRWFGAYKKALVQRSDIRLWANNENFDQTDWTSSPLDRVVRQVEITSKYVEKHITFSYNHYYSPLNINDGFHREYMHYVKTGSLSGIKPETPSALNFQRLHSGNCELSWNGSGNETAGYHIYRNGVLIGNCKYKRRDGGEFIPELKTSFIIDESGKNGKISYEVEAFSFGGIVSPKAELTINL